MQSNGCDMFCRSGLRPPHRGMSPEASSWPHSAESMAPRHTVAIGMFQKEAHGLSGRLQSATCRRERVQRPHAHRVEHNKSSDPTDSPTGRAEQICARIIVDAMAGVLGERWWRENVASRAVLLGAKCCPTCWVCGPSVKL